MAQQILDKYLYAQILYDFYRKGSIRFDGSDWSGK